VEDCRTDAADHRGQDQQPETIRGRDQHDAREREQHGGRQCIGHGMLVGEIAHQRLQDRRCHLLSERDQADLHIVQPIGVLEQGIERRQQELHQVVEQVRGADRQDNSERCPLHCGCSLGRNGVHDRESKMPEIWAHP
jgi:hypothetical protein